VPAAATAPAGGAARELQRLARELDRLRAEKAAAEQRVAELSATARQAAALAEAERAEREQLLAEKAAAEQRSAELTGAVRRAAELAEVARQAAERAASERRQREGLEVEKARIERRLLAPAEDFRKGDVGAPAGAPRSTALPSLGGLFASDERGTGSPLPRAGKSSLRPAISRAFFRVDPELADIVYDSADDVLEVHQSIGMTQLSLEGHPNQYCSAYIVILKKGPGRQVYVAFRLAASHRVLVYVPPTPPGDPEAYGRTMKEAARFLRATGIETESLPLGKSPRSRTQALRQIPVLRPAPPSSPSE
jgi:hypothetical protein